MPKIPDKYEDWTPPWAEGEFDAEAAKRLVYNALHGQQKAKESATELRTKLDAAESELATATSKLGDKGKDDTAKDTELAELRTKVRDLEKDGRPEDKSLIQRLEVAIDHGLAKSDARRLVGNTVEELEDDAAELAERFGIKKGDEGGNGGDTKQQQPPSRQPIPGSQLGNGRGGGNGGQPQLVSAAELVKQGTTAVQGIPSLTR